MNSRLKYPVNANDHIKGNKEATLELVEYGDFQCSHCGEAYKIVKKIQKKMGDDLKFVFRNFPLAESHPYAYPAAQAAEAAAIQNKYWQMHDLLYEHQQQLEDTNLLGYAKTIGLDIAKFKTDYQSASTLAKIEQDFESGVISGVNGTPSFFINGMKYQGDWRNEEEFIHYLKSALVS